MISAEVIIKIQFYDLDPMRVVWHGNYPRFLEQARAVAVAHGMTASQEQRARACLLPDSNQSAGEAQRDIPSATAPRTALPTANEGAQAN